MQNKKPQKDRGSETDRYGPKSGDSSGSRIVDGALIGWRGRLRQRHKATTNWLARPLAEVLQGPDCESDTITHPQGWVGLTATRGDIFKVLSFGKRSYKKFLDLEKKFTAAA